MLKLLYIETIIRINHGSIDAYHDASGCRNIKDPGTDSILLRYGITNFVIQFI